MTITCEISINSGTTSNAIAYCRFIFFNSKHEPLGMLSRNINPHAVVNKYDHTRHFMCFISDSMVGRTSKFLIVDNDMFTITVQSFTVGNPPVKFELVVQEHVEDKELIYRSPSEVYMPMVWNCLIKKGFRRRIV
jgi:hypothetical protein